MKIIFNKDIYFIDAVKSAIEAYSDLAEFLLEDNKSEIVVTLDNIDKGVISIIRDEFSNYVLGESIRKKKNIKSSKKRVIEKKKAKNDCPHKDLAFFRFRELKKGFIATNDFGFHIFLSKNEFADLMAGRLKKDSRAYKELLEKFFLEKSYLSNKEELASIYRKRYSFFFNPGPGLHIVAVTLRCNLGCIYCQAASQPMSREELDMPLDVARKTVDFILNSPSPNITIEFQGGEPLANWKAVEFIVEYAQAMNQLKKKNLRFALVTNLTMMTDGKLEFLIKNGVGLCTSLDGPEELHNKNRPWAGHNSYQETTKWIKKIQKRIKEEKKLNSNNSSRLSALPTISKFSLGFPEEMIDEYLKWDFTGIHLRPVAVLGLAEKNYQKVKMSTEEFCEFWKKGIDYIISKNKEGKDFYEREAAIMLDKILSDRDNAYTDLRSPCGAALGQVSYDHQGNIYTCDEGRMIPDDVFKIGDVGQSFREAIMHQTVGVMQTASCLENLACDNCAYKPYCGVCPIKNYRCYGNLFPPVNSTDECKIKMFQFDYIFNLLQDKETKEILKNWIKYGGRKAS
jgi:uncharacterized protein